MITEREARIIDQIISRPAFERKARELVAEHGEAIVVADLARRAKISKPAAKAALLTAEPNGGFHRVGRAYLVNPEGQKVFC